MHRLRLQNPEIPGRATGEKRLQQAHHIERAHNRLSDKEIISSLESTLRAVVATA